MARSSAAPSVPTDDAIADYLRTHGFTVERAATPAAPAVDLAKGVAFDMAPVIAKTTGERTLTGGGRVKFDGKVGGITVVAYIPEDVAPAGMSLTLTAS